MKHVDGENKGNVTLYAISTCGWCKKTKRLLNDLNVAYDYVDVDLLNQDEKGKMKEKVRQCNPQLSYPTFKINGECILGFKEPEIKEALKNE